MCIRDRVNNICQMYSKALQGYYQNLRISEPLAIVNDVDDKKRLTRLQRQRSTWAERTEAFGKIVEEQSYMSLVQKFSKGFDTHLREFITVMNQMYTKFDTHLLNLLTRLDYDGFYNKYQYQTSNFQLNHAPTPLGGLAANNQSYTLNFSGPTYF
eukprot:TRINITY_DN2117_c0_g3_i2.p1 TRINITY_DN2117_c0_g3~~TRINITY_DN2117_c0_g3_i2.p1  ORF type:complete len:155 (+),score=19.60 TRINITY_DN2117_c0_g3_i2:66-530(+)